MRQRPSNSEQINNCFTPTEQKLLFYAHFNWNRVKIESSQKVQTVVEQSKHCKNKEINQQQH